MTTFLHLFTASTGLLRKTCAISAWLLLSAAVLDCGAASDAYVPLAPARSLPMDGVTYEWIGRQALAQYGYEEIIKRGVDAGFLRYPDSEQTNARNLVGQTMADAAREAWPVFTEGAVMALLTSQLDSPAPGPMDVLALGMLVVAISEAGSVAAMVLTTSTTATATTATPVPTVTAVPTATATTTTTSPPIAVPRRYPNQTCEEVERVRLEAAKDVVCPISPQTFPGENCRPTRANAKLLPLYPCSLIKARIAAVTACVAARQKVQDECFKNGDPQGGHIKQIDDLTKSITWCGALKVVNCAPSHPMSGL